MGKTVQNKKNSERPTRKTKKNKFYESSYLKDDENFSEFSKQLEEIGLKLRDIPGDGNCLFRALGDQLKGKQSNHLQLRQETVNYMVSHRTDFEPFVADDCSFTDHIKELRLDGTYAGNDAIVAFARKFEVNVIIHQLNEAILAINGVKNKSKNTRQLHISYHNGDHYSSVRKIGDETNQPNDIQLISDSEQKADTSRHSLRNIIKQVKTATGIKDKQLIKKTFHECDDNVEYTISVIQQWHQETTEKSKIKKKRNKKRKKTKVK